MTEAGSLAKSARSAPKLFVVGCPRSGTSWVTTLLAHHPSVVMVPAETHVYRLVYEPFVELPTWTAKQRFRSWKGILRRYGPLPLLRGFQPSDIWRGMVRDYAILNRPNSHGLHALVPYAKFKALVKAAQSQPGSALEQAEALIASLFDTFLEQQGYPNPVMLEKTPMHIRYGDRILRRFPEARLIEVMRDGRDVCASYNALAKQHPWARIGTAGAIRQWKRCITWGETWRAQPDLASRIHTVRYETLKADPHSSLQAMLDFAQLAWSEEHIQTSVQASDISQIRIKGEGQYTRKGTVGDWKNQLSEAEVALCRDTAGEQLARLGYI